MGSQTIVMQDPFPCTALWWLFLLLLIEIYIGIYESSNSRCWIGFFIYHAHRPRTLEGKTRTESYGPGLHWQWHLRLWFFPYSAWPHSHSKASSALVGAQSGAYKSWGEWVGRHCKGTSQRVGVADGGETAGDVVCLEWDEGRKGMVWMATCLQKTIGCKRTRNVCNVFEGLWVCITTNRMGKRTIWVLGFRFVLIFPFGMLV